ncbi:hypothetical protein [Rickettsia endosymbiont of Pantilius tunicatus]|uniref:hypothetical protein n=1 Tax=Rickettsia endosymbiont of Pantilius tunicatus TaxID=3066267 RepID=UPI0030DE57B5
MAHKDLSHLTKEQIKDLIKRYYNHKKMVDLLEEFDINVHPNTLIKLFPPIIHNELFCKYCLDVNLVSKLESRNHANCNVVHFEKFCPACDHRDNSHCPCSHCKDIRKQKKQAEEENKRNILMQTFLSTNIDIPAVEELTLKDAVYLISTAEHSATKDFEFIKPYLEGPTINSLVPDEELIYDIIEHLNRRGFIQINPLKNNLDVFKFDLNDKVVGYYRDKLLWEFLPNMDIKEKIEYLNLILNITKGEWSFSWKNDVIEMWELITKYECLENLKCLLEEHSFPEMDQHAEKQALSTFIDLFEDFSVGQIFNLSWQAVRDTKYESSLEKTSYYRYNKDNIATIIINRIQPIALRIIANRWAIKNSKREYCTPQTILSSVFFDLFLDRNKEYFENVIPSEYSK